MHRAHGREGFGLILAITTLFLLTWAIVGIAQMSFSGQVTESVQSATTGNMAVAYAQTAIEEAFHQVSKRVNQSGDPLFASLREEYRTTAGSRKTFQVRPELTMAVLARDPLYAGFELADGAVEVQLLSERPLTTLTYESRGTLQFSARVKHGPTRIARTVRETRGFKVALLSTPRPFDQVTWLLRHPWRLYETFQGEANHNIDESLSTVRNLGVDRDQKSEQVVAMLNAMNPQVDDANDAIAKLNKNGGMLGLSKIDERADTWIAGDTRDPMASATIAQDPGFQGTDVTAAYHEFPEDLILYSVDGSLPGLTQQYYLPPQVSAQNQRISDASTVQAEATQKLADLYEKARTRLDEIRAFRAKVEQAPPTPAAIEPLIDEGRRLVHQTNELRARFAKGCQVYAQATSQLSAEHQNRWEIYHRLTSAFRKLSGPKAAEVASYDSKFDVASGEQSQMGRAFFKFTGPRAAQRFLQFLADAPAGRPLNATIFVDNADETLKLAGTRIHGKLSLSVSGNVELSGVQLADAANDLFTIHTASGRTVRISGRVQASVMAAGTVDLADGAQLSGNLILWDLPSPGSLNGTIQSDARYYSGVSSTRDQRLDHFVVALHPMPSAQTIARN